MIFRWTLTKWNLKVAADKVKERAYLHLVRPQMEYASSALRDVPLDLSNVMCTVTKQVWTRMAQFRGT